jgi:uncharacterized membrane protein
MTSLAFPSPVNRRWFFLRTEMDRLLTASMLFSCILVGIRIFHTGKITFIFMIWNLFLAYVPYAISRWMTVRNAHEPLETSAAHEPLETSAAHEARETGAARKARGRLSQLFTILLFLTWLLFIPNSFYILTDLYHLADNHRNSRVPEWFDLSLILSFAWNGLLLGILSVRHIEKILIPQDSIFKEWLFLYPVMWLNALGVYTGRYLRYNSWDIITNPFQLLSDIFRMVIHPLRHDYAWGMIFCFSILLTLFYSLIRKGSKALT